MAKLARLGWPAGIAFRAYGLSLGVRVSDPAALERVQRHLPYGWKPAKRPGVDHMFSLAIASGAAEQETGGPRRWTTMRRFHAAYSEAHRMVRTTDLDELFDTFESGVRMLVAEFATDRVFVHAGVVAWRDRAILIPGRTYCGKTSLVAEFVRAGATYYSDEYAVLDSQGRVHPFIKPLSLREGDDGRQTHYGVEAFGGVAGTRPVPVGCVVVTQYRQGARWAPKPLSAGRTALSMFENTVSARRVPEIALDAVRRAAADAKGIKSERGEAAEVV